LDVSLWI